MATNKRITNRAKVRSAKELARQAVETPQPRRLKDKAKDLEGKLHRLEVEIAASSRIYGETRRRSRDELPPPEPSRKIRSGPKRLTHAQTREKRRTFYMQVLEFAVTALLFVGACAWLYQWWLSRTAI